MVRASILLLALSAFRCAAQLEDDSLCLLQRSADLYPAGGSGRASLLSGGRSSSDSAMSVVRAALMGEEGYQSMLDTSNKDQMRSYFHRVAAVEGLRITNEKTLSGVLPWYTGECAVQSHAALVAELQRGTQAKQCKAPWVARVTASLAQINASVASPSDHRAYAHSAEPLSTWHWAAELEASLAALQAELHHLQQEVQETELISAHAPLNETGYELVAAENSTVEMMAFVRRVVAQQGMRLNDERPLGGLAMYYSGQCATQSYDRLVKELQRVSAKNQGQCGGRWLQFIGPW